MRKNNIAGHITLDGFVRSKLKRLERSDKSFRALYELMFSERENVMFEQSSGYRIIYTTYGECRDSIDRRAKTLRGLLNGLPSGSIAGIYMNNSRDWVEMLWAVLRCGYSPLLMNLRLDAATLREAVAEYGVGAVIADRDIDLGAGTIICRDIVPAKEKLEDGPFGGEILVMSSGTSSHIKVCAYTAAEIAAQIADSCAIIRTAPEMKRHYKGQLKQLVFLPLYHIFGLSAVYIWFAFFSRTFVLLNDMSPQTILNTIRRHKVTHIFAVPMLWDRVYGQACRAIRERGEKTWNRFEKGLRLANAVGNIPLLRDMVSWLLFREVRLNLFGPSIRFMISGGSEIRPCVLEFMNGIGYRLANGYGMTETGITSVELSGNKRILGSGSVGKPFASVQYSINGEGELMVRGKTLARTVWNEGIKAENNGEWFHTGDLAECENGRYRILGRIDDLVIAPSGENLNPNLIEQKLMVAGIRGLCLAGIREEQGVQPVIVVSVKAYTDAAKLTKIRAAIAEKLKEAELAGLISKIVFVSDELIEPDDIKLNRVRIAKRLQSGKMNIMDPDTMQEQSFGELERHIRLCFANALGKDTASIAADSDFFVELGGSSLDYFAMLSKLQEEFDVLVLPDNAGHAPSTPAEIAEYIRNADGERL